MHTENTLIGTLIFLRSLGENDASASYASWLNDPLVNRYLETRSVTINELKTYIREKAAKPDALLLGIFWKENGTHIGNVKLEPIDGVTKEATLGILIGDKNYWGKGVATEATNLITEYAFTTLGLRAVSLGVIADHIAAIRVYEKCGFSQVRIDKKAMDHDGVLYDRVVMQKRQ